MADNPDSLEELLVQEHLDGTDPDSKSAARFSSSETALVPRPSDDPREPLVCLSVIYLAHHLNATYELVTSKNQKSKIKNQNHQNDYLVFRCNHPYRFGLGLRFGIFCASQSIPQG